MKFDTPAPEPQSPQQNDREPGRLTRAGWKWAFLLLLPAILFGPQLYDLACDYVVRPPTAKGGTRIASRRSGCAHWSIDRAVQWEPPAYQH